LPTFAGRATDQPISPKATVETPPAPPFMLAGTFDTPAPSAASLPAPETATP